MKPAQLKLLSNLCFILGFASILGSIAVWFLTGGQAADTRAHAERFGIFVGLWAPTFSFGRTASTATRNRLPDGAPYSCAMNHPAVPFIWLIIMPVAAAVF